MSGVIGKQKYLTHVSDIWNKIMSSGINNGFNRIKECIGNLREKIKPREKSKWGNIEHGVKDNEKVSGSLIHGMGAREKGEGDGEKVKQKT